MHVRAEPHIIFDVSLYIIELSIGNIVFDAMVSLPPQRKRLMQYLIRRKWLNKSVILLWRKYLENRNPRYTRTTKNIWQIIFFIKLVDLAALRARLLPVPFFQGSSTRKTGRAAQLLYSLSTVCNCLPARLMINRENARTSPDWRKIHEPTKKLSERQRQGGN